MTWIEETIERVQRRENTFFKSVTFGDRDTVFVYRNGHLEIHKNATYEKFEEAIHQKQSASSSLASTPEEFSELCVLHEIAHHKQENLRKYLYTSFDSHRRREIQRWFKEWESHVEKKHRGENWHPSEYCKRHVKMWNYTREWFAESYVLYRNAPEKIEDPIIKSLLEKFEKL